MPMVGSRTILFCQVLILFVKFHSIETTYWSSTVSKMFCDKFIMTSLPRTSLIGVSLLILWSWSCSGISVWSSIYFQCCPFFLLWFMTDNSVTSITWSVLGFIYSICLKWITRLLLVIAIEFVFLRLSPLSSEELRSHIHFFRNKLDSQIHEFIWALLCMVNG